MASSNPELNVGALAKAEASIGMHQSPETGDPEPSEWAFLPFRPGPQMVLPALPAIASPHALGLLLVADMAETTRVAVATSIRHEGEVLAWLAAPMSVRHQLVSGFQRRLDACEVWRRGAAPELRT
eukprot:CAMPEP_0181494078 /NCGR_PEP_ID=MMETSP1110-20121109/51558_1 /TAXON_ID=174948 /ORGANISM="Symbiodinium sp., Strain CCMP421" /LENGTH=125 /DNA_ID=CAMNT_0023621423 /DNA_START=20 /DNA_END=398 /DNA_ORIENTATION=-